MQLGVVVLHYRFWPGVRATLDAVLAQTIPPDRVLVVDNRSDDGSVGELRAAFPGVDVLEAPENRGYAAGMNLGLETLLAWGADRILLLTHDCRLAADAIERLTARLDENPRLGAVGPLLGYASRPEKVFSAGGEVDRRTWHTYHVRTPDLMRDWTGQLPRTVAWLDGAALLLRAAAVRETGRLNERYFMYYEEIEFLLRLGARGWMVECVPAARGWQEPGPKDPYLMTRNWLGYSARTAPRTLLARHVLWYLRTLSRRSLQARGVAERAEVRAQWKGYLHFLIGRWGPRGSSDGWHRASDATGRSSTPGRPPS